MPFILRGRIRAFEERHLVQPRGADVGVAMGTCVPVAVGAALADAEDVGVAVAARVGLRPGLVVIVGAGVVVGVGRGVEAGEAVGVGVGVAVAQAANRSASGSIGSRLGVPLMVREVCALAPPSQRTDRCVGITSRGRWHL